jgi:hypothetical protein
MNTVDSIMILGVSLHRVEGASSMSEYTGLGWYPNPATRKKLRHRCTSQSDNLNRTQPRDCIHALFLSDPSPATPTHAKPAAGAVVRGVRNTSCYAGSYNGLRALFVAATRNGHAEWAPNWPELVGAFKHGPNLKPGPSEKIIRCNAMTP